MTSICENDENKIQPLDLKERAVIKMWLFVNHVTKISINSHQNYRSLFNSSSSSFKTIVSSSPHHRSFPANPTLQSWSPPSSPSTTDTRSETRHHHFLYTFAIETHKRNNSRSNFKLLYLFFISLWLISNYFRNKNISFPNLISPNSVTHPDLYFSFYFTKLIKILSFLYWKRNEQSTNYMPFGFRCLCYWWWIVNINCREERWTKLWVVENW